MIRRLTFSLRALLVLVLLPSAAFAQLQAPNRLDVVERVHAACPGLIQQDHAFTDAVATLLNQEDGRWGRNGKRGNTSDPSHDAIAWKNPAVPFGVSIVDMIGCAGGGPNCSPSPAWIDQTAETLRLNTTGAWVAPSGRLPACLTGATPPPVTTPPPLTQTVNLQPVLEALARLQADVAELKARPQPEPPPSVDLAIVESYVDDMVGAGPGGDPAVVPNHITDLKQRLDVLRVQLEQLAAWLRSRPVLRF